MGKIVLTPEQTDKALNPELTDAKALLCGKQIKVIVMSLKKEQVFIKSLKELIPNVESTVDIVNALIDIDPERLCALAAIVANHAGESFTAEDIFESTRLVDIIAAIETQIREQGYLDFLLQITGAVPGLLTVKR